MKVLVACEVSGTVRDAFRRGGHDAWSCDIQENDSPFHICCDVTALLRKRWDLIIGHPPCTYLSTVGNKWFKTQPERYQKRQDAFDFFLKLWNCKCPRVCLENPQGFLNTNFRPPDQTVNPFDFGESFRKRTCLWLRGLPPLQATHFPSENLFDIPICEIPKPIHFDKNGRGKHWCEMIVRMPPKERANARSKTFAGIAQAMADQWGK